MAGGHWHLGDPDILIVADSGYGLPRLAWLLADLPINIVGRVLRIGAKHPSNWLGKPPERLQQQAEGTKALHRDSTALVSCRWVKLREPRSSCPQRYWVVLVLNSSAKALAVCRRRRSGALHARSFAPFVHDAR